MSLPGYRTFKRNIISFDRLIVWFKRYNKSFKRDLCYFYFRSNFLVLISILVNIGKERHNCCFSFFCSFFRNCADFKNVS